MQEIKRKLKLRDVKSAKLPWLWKSHAKKKKKGKEMVGMRFNGKKQYFCIEVLQIYKFVLMHRT